MKRKNSHRVDSAKTHIDLSFAVDSLARSPAMPGDKTLMWSIIYLVLSIEDLFSYVHYIFYLRHDRHGNVPISALQQKETAQTDADHMPTLTGWLRQGTIPKIFTTETTLPSLIHCFPNSSRFDRWSHLVRTFRRWVPRTPPCPNSCWCLR